MNTLLIKNARAVLTDCVTEPVCITLQNGLIEAIGASQTTSAGQTIDANGGYVFPGFVDVHVHGGGGADFMDGTVEAFETAIKSHLQTGTTTLVPTAMTATQEELLQFIRAYRQFKKISPYAPLAAGLHLEGPYFSAINGKSKGAQSGSLIRGIDFDEIDTILSEAKGCILRWDAAPEVAKSKEFAKRMRENGILPAVAHTNATAEEADAGFTAGFSHVTHFYNAVTAYQKREQLVTAGVVEAAYLNDTVTVELICDGRHIPKHCLQLARRIKGREKVLGITDAMRLAGTDATRGKLGSLTSGTEVIVEDDVAKLPDRSSYAGSTCTMDRALRVLCHDYGLSLSDAAWMLSTAPAGFLGLGDRIGTVTVGKQADLVITDRHLRITAVLTNGNVVSV